jgi:predicted transposase YdaD
MTQVVQHLPSKHKALSSNPSTAKRKEGRKEGRKELRKEGTKERIQDSNLFNMAALNILKSYRKTHRELREVRKVIY